MDKSIIQKAKKYGILELYVIGTLLMALFIPIKWLILIEIICFLSFILFILYSRLTHWINLGFPEDFAYKIIMFQVNRNMDYLLDALKDFKCPKDKEIYIAQAIAQYDDLINDAVSIVNKHPELRKFFILATIQRQKEAAENLQALHTNSIELLEETISDKK